MRKIALSKAVEYASERISANGLSIDNFITTDNMLQNKAGVTRANYEPAGTMPAFNTGDILVANIRPYLKKIWYATFDGGCSADVLVFKVKEGYDPMYVYYAMLRDDFFAHMMKGSKGTKMPRGDKNQTLEFLILDFDYTTQQKIAAVLSSLDAKIAINNRINTELEAMAKTLYDYWFVQFNFPDANGRPYKTSGGKMEWNKVLKREVPIGWEVHPLSYFLDCNQWSISKKNKISKINYLDTSNLTKNIIDTVVKIDCKREKVPSRAQRIVSPNDILFSTVRPNQNHFGIIKHPLQNMVASSGFAQLRSKDSNLGNDFFFLYLTSETTVNRLQRIAESSVSAYPSISPNDILELRIPLPKDTSIFSDINSRFDIIFKIITNNLQQNKKTVALRDWLLPMLMNGQVTVADGEERVAMAAEEKVAFGKQGVLNF